MGIPQRAVDRFLMLRGKADGLYAARMEAQYAWEREWNEVKRLEGAIRSLYPNQYLEIDAAGQIAVIERLRGNPHILGYATTFPDSRERRTVMKLDAGTQQRVQLLLAGRRRLAQADAHRQRQGASGNGLLQLVEACQKELLRCGWAPSGTPEVRLS
jgi:hypothetical protein